jgi:uncharacterized membrane protein YfcA
VWRLAVPIGLAGIVGALLGARAAIGLDPDVLGRLFGLLLIAVAIRMFWRARSMDAVSDRSEPESGPS